MFDIPCVLAALQARRETVLPSLLEFLRQAENGYLAEGVPHQEWAQGIAKACRPTLFSKPKVKLPYEAWNKAFPGAEPLLVVRVSELLELQQALLPAGRLFLGELGGFADKVVALTLNGDGDETFRKEALVREATYVVLPSLAEHFEVDLTLPSVEEVFPELETMPLSNEWYWDRVELYEEWTWQQRPRRGGAQPYIQLGGVGHFIQSGDQAGYVAQVDNQIGDCGNTYLLFTPDMGFVADVQMF